MYPKDNTDKVLIETYKKFCNSKELVDAYGVLESFIQCVTTEEKEILSTKKPLIKPSKRGIVRDTSRILADIGLTFRDVNIVSKDNVRLASVFKVPIVFSKEGSYDELYGAVSVRDFNELDFDFSKTLQSIEKNSGFSVPKEIVEKLRRRFDDLLVKRTLVDNIVMNIYNRKMAASVYTHEILHTQVSEKLHNCLHINSETLPIFGENIVAVKNDKTMVVTEFLRATRINDTRHKSISLFAQEKFTAKELDKIKKYFTSTFQGLYLSDLYLNSSPEIQKEIIRDINHIINFDHTLEDFMDKYDVSLERIPKKYIKSLYFDSNKAK